MPEQVNRECPPKNTTPTVQLSSPYTDPEPSNSPPQDFHFLTTSLALAAIADRTAFEMLIGLNDNLYLIARDLNVRHVSIM